MTTAQLGFAIDSSQAEGAAVDLDKLTASATKAEAAAKRFSAGADQAEAATEGMAGSMAHASAAASQMGKVIDLAAAAEQRGIAGARAHASAMRAGSFATANLAAQFQDVAVQAATATNPLQIALQQGTQISAVFGGMGASGAIKSLGAAFLSVVSPVALVTIGLVGFAAAGLQAVNWVKVGQTTFRAVANVLPEIATGAALAGTALAVAFAPQILSSVTSLTVALGTGLVTALQAVSAAALANPFTAFVVAIGAALGAAIIFRDDLKQILGVDVVGFAKDAANLVIGSFVAAFHDLQFVWQHFPDVISAAATGAANAAISAINAMVAAAASGINAVIDLANNIPGLNIGHVGAAQIGSLANPAAGRLDLAGLQKRHEADLSRDYVGGIGRGIGSAASMGADKLRSMASGLGFDEKAAKKAEKELERQRKAYTDLTRSLQQKTAASELEMRTLGMSADAAARLTAEQEALNKAADQHIKLSPQMRDALIANADAAADAATKAANLKSAYDLGRTTFTGFFSDLRSNLEDGKGLWGSFADAAQSALDRILDKFTEMAAGNLFDSIFQNTGGNSGGGFWSAIAGFFGGTSKNALGGVYGSAGLHAYSNSVVNRPTLFPFARGVGLMGEAGPEAIMPLRRGPDGRLGVAASNDNGGGITVNIINNNGSQVKARETSDGQGGRQLEIMVDDAVAKHLSNPGSKSSRALKNRFNLQPRLIA